MRNDIIVGLDDSPSSKAALQWAAQQAKSTDTRLRAVHALQGPTGLGSAGLPPAVDPMEVTALNLAELAPDELQDSHLTAILEIFKAVSPNPDWVLEFASGYAGEVLARLSQDAQLLVVGTREHVGLGRLLVGSVSHYCLSHAACPIVALPAAAGFDSGDKAEASVAMPAKSRSDQPTAAASPQAAMTRMESAESKMTAVDALRNRLIVAGVDGSAESLAATRYAAAAAGMRGCDLLLVHAFPPPPPMPASATVAALADARIEAEKLIAAAATQLTLPSGVHLHTLAEPGDPTAVLGVTGGWAEMLVLGRDNLSWSERVLLGAVTSAVARRVSSPLVVVPGGWRAGHVGKLPPVVVALDAETSGESALLLAFREAELRRTRLVILHAEPIGRSARDVAAAEFDLAVLLAKWKEDHRGVTVSTVMVSGDPDAQLVRWSRTAAVLVVGRPHELGWGSWMRSVARSVMKQTHCPLIIAPPNPIRLRHRQASAATAAMA